MNRDSDEVGLKTDILKGKSRCFLSIPIRIIPIYVQRAVPQTLCGALQKEANCKCLVLSVLIYGCLAAVTWCRCANVTKVVINFDNYPLKRTEHVSPCDEGYIYIPVAFMGMLYLVYLVECYHSPIRIDLFHADSQDNVMTKLSQLRMAQPTIWWKAVSYHYVRRKRQITRYRNGDNYTTTQVYYERANTYAATSFYFYDYCGVKDISKDLTTDTKIPITKITLTKGFAFSNMRSATEFEEARSRFFAEQELRDDYMEMREGLDLGYNFNPTNVVGVLGNPWFTNSYVYWCFSALLLSWPLRIIIEYNTQYADYQVTKLFGINYDTPTSGDQIHESSSQLSAPGSYMLAPSYSEALLMEPSPLASSNYDQSRQEAADSESRRNGSRDDDQTANPMHPNNVDIVPSYSEALLYERAQPAAAHPVSSGIACDCYCHVSSSDPNKPIINPTVSQDEGIAENCEISCSRCGNYYEDELTRVCERSTMMENSWSCFTMSSTREENRYRDLLTRDLSAPNFSTASSGEMAASASTGQFLRLNVNSLENISENEEPGEASLESSSSRMILDKSRDRTISRVTGSKEIGCGTIPKCRSIAASSDSTGYRLIENPMAEDDDDEEDTRKLSSDECLGRNMTNSKTYFCLKSILKQHRRRYTLVTPEELQRFAAEDLMDESGGVFVVNETKNTEKSGSFSAKMDRGRTQFLSRDSRSFWRNNRETATAGQATTPPVVADRTIRRVSSSRSLIFPSPIEETCRTMPNDPFGGKAVHVLPAAAINRNISSEKPPEYEAALGLPRFARLAKSLTSIQHNNNKGLITIDSSQRLLVRASNRSRNNNNNNNSGVGERRHRRNLSIEPEYLLNACRRNATSLDEESKTDIDLLEIGAGSSIDEENHVGCPSGMMPIQLRRNLTRGCSLHDGKTDRNRRKAFLRSSLIETTGSTSLSFDEERTSHLDGDIHSSSSKRINVSMETSL